MTEAAYRQSIRRGSSCSHSRMLPLFSSTSIILVLLFLNFTRAKPNCLRFADYNNINQAFTDGGPGAKVFLCPSKTYRLTGPIAFTAADQELATYGYPTGSERATLLLNGDFATAIQGDCRRCARVSISNLIIDGNRKKLGRIIDTSSSTGLVVIGGNEGQTVKSNLIRDPRGFTAVHVREGDKLQCKGVVIEKNEIGPVGDEFDPDRDGPDPETSPLGRPLADGVSIACRESYVRDNHFYDNTDAAIVVYGSPGSLIHANTITSRTLSAMAGILLVDSTPFDGDYSGTVVKGNIIEAASRIIRLGIGLGPSVWSDDTETVLKGGTVVANGIRGRHMGFGIAAAGLDGWTIKDNWDEAHHGGKRSARCFDEPVNPPPSAFIQNSKLIKNSKVQSNFIDAVFEYVVCIDGEEDPNSYLKDAAARKQAPKEDKHDQQEPLAAVVEDEAPRKTESMSTGSEVMDDILIHAQTRMLESIEMLARRVDIVVEAAKTKAPRRVSGDAPVIVSPQIAWVHAAGSAEVSTALVDLHARIGDVEARQQVLIDTALTMRSALRSWNNEMSTSTEWQFDVILDVQHRLVRYWQSEDSQNIDPRLGNVGDTLDRTRGLLDVDGKKKEAGRGSSWAQPIRFVMAQGIFFLAVVYIRAWLSRRRRSKVL